MSEWIDVKKEKPPRVVKDNKDESNYVLYYVLVVDEQGDMYVANMTHYPISDHRKKEEYFWAENTTGCGCCLQNLAVTHWMPLPLAPLQHE